MDNFTVIIDYFGSKALASALFQPILISLPSLISKLAELVHAECIYWNENIEPYEINRDKQIAEKLSKEKRKVYTFLDQLIVNPSDIKTNKDEPYKVYGPFYRKWIDIINITKSSKNNLIQTSETAKQLTGLNERELSSIKNSDLNYCITNKSKSIYELLFDE